MYCCCCYDDNFDEFITCNNNHVICKDCTNRGLKVAVGDMQYFKCTHESRCNLIFDLFNLNQIVSAELFNGYETVFSYLSTKDIENLHKCKNCNYAVILEGEHKVFTCIPCDKTYCICKKDLHEGTPCNTKIYEEAERLTNNHVIKCTCGFPITRGDACNHLRCTCGKMWCWYCKRPGISCGCPLNGDPIVQEAAITSNNIAANLAKVNPCKQQRVEAERIAKATLEKIERLEKERIERERIEVERLERLERERIERERLEAEKLERFERERIERQRLEAERIEKEKLKTKKLNAIHLMQTELEKKRPIVLQSKNKLCKYYKNIPIFICACSNGYFKVVEELLPLNDNNIDIDFGLFQAIKYNQVDIVELLIKDDEIKLVNDDSVIYAIKHNYIEIFKFLLEKINNQNIFKYLKYAKKLDNELISLYLREYELMK